MAMSDLLQDALDSIEQRPDGHLHLQTRREIRAAFGEVIGAHEEGGPSNAVRALVALDRLTAQHVIHYWEQALPGDHRPHRMLELAGEVLNGAVDPKDARRERSSFSTAAQNPDAPDEEGRASSAAVAATTVVLTAFGDEFTDEDAPPGTDDDGIDPHMLDCTMYASLAEAPLLGTSPPPEDIAARRAFWRWWLTEAVPQVARDAGIDVD